MSTSNPTYGTTISWATSNKDAIKADGTYVTPNADTLVTLTATITYDEHSDTAAYEVTAKKFYSDLDDGVIAGYLYGSEISSASDYTLEHLDIAYVSFGYPREDGTINISTVESRLNDFVDRCHDSGTYVLLSLQESASYGSATAFSVISADADLRQTFANNLVSLINTYHLDGIDMDWEHPDEGEETLYTELMHVLHDTIKANNRYHLLTTATSGAEKYTRFDLTNSIAYIDYINLMTYDLHSSSRSQFTSAMTKGSSKNYAAIDGTGGTYDNYLNTLGMPANKLILGIAFYGLVYHETDGIYQSAPREQTEKKSYDYMYTNYISQVEINDNLTKTWDETAQGYYIYDSVNRICVTFDDERSIGVKVESAYNHGLAGVMYWRDGQDHNDDLITAIVESIDDYY